VPAQGTHPDSQGEALLHQRPPLRGAPQALEDRRRRAPQRRRRGLWRERRVAEINLVAGPVTEPPARNYFSLLCRLRAAEADEGVARLRRELGGAAAWQKVHRHGGPRATAHHLALAR